MGMAQSSSSSSRPSDSEQVEEPSKPVMALDKAKEIVASSPVVVFSKSYCPFCARVKKLLTELGASYKVVELDVESDGSELQSALADWTGQRTVPCVFIKGKHIGGCDDTVAMHKEGNLVPLLTEAGIRINCHPFPVDKYLCQNVFVVCQCHRIFFL